MLVSAADILTFWFQELKPQQWYKVDPTLDEAIRERFGATFAAACRCELYEWRQQDEGRLAEVLVLDQFSRNLFRNSPKAFAADGLALALAQEAIATGVLERIENESYQHHLLLPHMHSESVKIHEQAVELRKKHGLDLEWEIKHKDIIDRFGRYPHRNEVLGRESTPEEVEFLKQPGSSF